MTLESKYSVAMTEQVDLELRRHLLRNDGQEDLCFALWTPSKGKSRTSALVTEPLLPFEGERTVHGNASFETHYFQRAVARAAQAGKGLVFLHSHLGPGWQGMSYDDDVAERDRLAAATATMTELPLVGMTLGTDGAWSARFWPRVAPKQYERQWCESVRVVGDALRATYQGGSDPEQAAERTCEAASGGSGSRSCRSVLLPG